MRIIACLFCLGALPLFAVAFGASEETKLIMAISRCEIETTRQLLEAGADVNGADERGQPILRWLASSASGCSDASALEVTKLLDEHGARFEYSAGKSGPSLLVNLAARRLPRTLAFLASKHGTGDPTQALRAIATRDLESVRVLLEAGADPTDGAARGSALMDAALANRPDLVAEMMKHVEDTRSPKVLAASEAAMRRGNGPVVEAFTRGGVTPSTRPTPATPSCEPRGLTTEESALLARVGLVDRPASCKFIQACGDVILVDCNSAADGPAYYIDRRSSRLLARCGGACMGGCVGCPPQAWRCQCRR